MPYYDRRVPSELLDLICPAGPLAWLPTWLRSPAAQALDARLDFRREDNDRKRGGLQVYVGRTSPLEVRGQARKRVKLTADAEYKAITPGLFKTVPYETLRSMQGELREHLETCGRRAASTLTGGEAITHAGLMRRYGLSHHADDPILAVDSEVRVGFRAAEGLSGSVWRSRHEEDLRAVTGLPKRHRVPRKLDTIGILPAGQVALVEVKAERGDIVRALFQAAAHSFTFQKLITEPDSNLRGMLGGMVEQKLRAGLLPPGTASKLVEPPTLVPVVAAPDARPGWVQAWLKDSSAARMVIGPQLDGLRFWRLSKGGELLEEHIP